MQEKFKQPLEAIKLEKGIYQDAEKENKSYTQYIEELFSKEKNYDSPYLNLSMLEIEAKKKAFELRGEEIPLTALEIQFAVRDIKVSGPYCDKIEKFFSTNENAVLFPAYMATEVFSGIMIKSLIAQWIMQELVINALSYEKAILTNSEDNRQTKKVTEGSIFRKFKIDLAKESVKLQKFGGELVSSYEAIKYLRISILNKFLENIGSQIGIDEFDEFLNVCLNGDGNSNGIDSSRTCLTATSGTIAVADVIKWATFLQAPYKIDHFIGRKALLNTYYTTLAGMNAPRDQFGFIGISLPAANEWDRDIVAADEFIGVDSKNAILMLTDGPVLIESDRVINRQIENTVISKRSGFAVQEKLAIAKFDCTHS